MGYIMISVQKPTIEITGLGRVYVDTSAKTVIFALDIDSNGFPVNCVVKNVSTDKSYHKYADLIDAGGYYLKEIKAGVFMLCPDPLAL